MENRLNNMVFVTGFARGGTTWLRNCIGFHPEIGCINRELVAFRDHGTDRAAIERVVNEAVESLGLETPRFVEKSPANAPHIHTAVTTCPEAKFIFIIRDPRDVFISHKRGTRTWMGGKNSRVDGCMEKTRRYYEGYRQAAGAENLLLVRYEDLHQNFHATMNRVYAFIGVDASPALINDCYKANDFWQVASRHIERRDEAARKGVVGDWVLHLEEHEAKWYRSSAFWNEFMQEHGYDWQQMLYRELLETMSHANPHALDEDDLMANRLDPERLNLVLTHDIDRLTHNERLGRKDFSIESVLETARIEAELKLASFFFFLPLDDVRYKTMKPQEVIDLIKEIQRIHPKATIGLHLNAAERFFPADMEESDDSHPDMPKAVAYLHEQIAQYAKYGVQFQVATAHGYGRRKKRPNNRDSELFTEELKKAGVLLWDTVLRPTLYDRASGVTAMADVGGAISTWFMPTSRSLLDPQCYKDFPPNHLIHILTHPGNYDMRCAMPLGRRTNVTLERDAPSKVAVA